MQEFDISDTEVSRETLEIIKELENLNPKIMTPTPINDNQLQSLLRAIPEFTPGEHLSLFVNEVDNLFNHLNQKITQEQFYLINFTIRSRIKGKARDFLSYQRATEWPEIRKNLLQKYGEQRSEEILAASLAQCVQKRQETYQDFHNKILENLNSLMQQISLVITDPNYLEFKTAEYTKLALKTFLNGLLDPYQSHLANFTITSLEEGLNKCVAYDNKKIERDYSEFIRRSQDQPQKHNPFTNPFQQKYNPFVNPFQKHNSNPFQQKHNFGNPFLQNYQSNPFKQNFGHNNPFYQKSHFQNNQSKPPFPWNPRPFNQKFLSNKQVFGKDAKPPFSTNARLPPPEPMSVQTRMSNPKPNFSQQPRHHLPQLKFQELYNAESYPTTKFRKNERTYKFQQSSNPFYSKYTPPEQNFTATASRTYPT